MEKNNQIIETIDSIFNDENFLLSALDDKKIFDINNLYQVLTMVLDYCIATRDTKTNLTIKEVKDNFTKLNDHYLTKEEFDNIITNGFLTHSFCGNECQYVSEHGFDYWDKITQEEKRNLQHIRNGLKRLEYEVGKNPFLTFREEDNLPEIVDKEVFMTFPGTKTIHYSKHAPERFYYGPVGRSCLENFPMIVGESKKDYLMRILKYRIENFTFNVEQEELLEVAERVIDYYIDKNTTIAFIDIQDIIDKPIYTVFYENENADNLKKFCATIELGKFSANQVFTHFPNDASEGFYDIGNLVTLSTNIPITSLSFASFPDIYDLKQKYLKQKGINEGTPVIYETCKELKKIRKLPDKIRRLYK